MCEVKSMAEKYERFIVKEVFGGILGSAGQQMILIDKETGVNYLFVKAGYAGGLTPLLDAEGKPVVTVVE